MDLIKFKKYKLPDTPGVYFFKIGQKILYIGKATSLRDRVSSYFSAGLNQTRGPGIKLMIEKASSLWWQETDSVLEALLLETNLIKKHQPPYNARAKDDKSYWQVIITREDWPRVLLVRGRDLSLSIDPGLVANSFGPFPSASEVKEALKIIRKIFPFRDKCSPAKLSLEKVKRASPLQANPCFNRQIGLCPGVCTGEISQADYRHQIKHIKLLFEGHKNTLMKNLKLAMNRQAASRNYEQAAIIRNQIFALNHIRDVALIKKDNVNRSDGFRIEAYDIAHLAGQDTVGVMTVVVSGELARNDYRRFNLRGETREEANDTANLKEVLDRRLKHSDWPRPNLMVVDGGQAQVNTAKKLLVAQKIKIPVVGVVKDENHRPKNIIGDQKLIDKYSADILLANNEAHRFAINYHRYKRRKNLF